MILVQACGSNDTSSSDTTKDSSDHSARTDKSTNIPDLKPAQPKPDWAPDIDDNMQMVMDKLASYGDPALETLPAQEARKQHTPTHAVMDVMKENGISMPLSMVDTMGKDIPVSGGMIHARIYTPKMEMVRTLLLFIIMVVDGSLQILIHTMHRQKDWQNNQELLWYQFTTVRPRNINFLLHIMMHLLPISGYYKMHHPSKVILK